MERRVVLTGLAAAAAAPALAQTSTKQPGATGAGGIGGSESRASRMGGQQMTPADMQHIHQTMQLGMVALETSQIAQQKAQNADLKRFATFEVQEQTTLAEVLRSAMEPATTAATGPSDQPGQTGAASASAPPTQIDAQSREMIQRLQKTQAGEAFDREYLQGQMEGHSALLQVQTQYVQSNPQNREHMNVAKLARTMIIEHVALLEDIQSKMR
jgi:predicted outer membrane protein